MMAGIQGNYYGLYLIALVFCTVLGLGIAYRLTPQLESVFRRIGLTSFFSRRALRALLLFVFAYVFATPFVDLLHVLVSIPQILCISCWTPPPTFDVIFGSAPAPLESLLEDLLTVVVYGFVLWSQREVASQRLPPSERLLTPGTIDNRFLMLGIGGLVKRAADFVVLQVLALGVFVNPIVGNRGLAGFAAGWGLALFWITLILLVITLRLGRPGNL
ncbi:MAG: hypothetical protein M1570_00735 [Chloroflexi bacterium]|nr:hypothetical protein [Chloroflexota bacterium]